MGLGVTCERGVVVLFVYGVGAEEVEDLLADLLELHAEVHQDLRRDALVLFDESEEQVLGADVVVSEVARLFEGELEHLLRAGREGQLSHRDHRGSGLDDVLDLGADLGEVHAHLLEDVGGDAAALLDES